MAAFYLPPVRQVRASERAPAAPLASPGPAREGTRQRAAVGAHGLAVAPVAQLRANLNLPWLASSTPSVTSTRRTGAQRRRDAPERIGETRRRCRLGPSRGDNTKPEAWRQCLSPTCAPLLSRLDCGAWHRVLVTVSRPTSHRHTPARPPPTHPPTHPPSP